MADHNQQQADFGYRQVLLDEKQELVDDVFHSVAGRYDLMNDLMSLGLHRAWKDALVTAVNPPKNRPFALLDIAGGTGDIAMRVIAAGGPETRAVISDINAGMLDVGKPVICVVNGPAIGGGAELAAFGDLVIATTLAAIFGSVMMGVKRWGIPSYMPSSTRLGSTRISRTSCGVAL